MQAFACEASDREPTCFADLPDGIPISQDKLAAIYRAYTSVRSCLLVESLPPLKKEMVQIIFDGQFPSGNCPDEVLEALKNFRPSKN